MRLKKVETGHRLQHKLILWIISLQLKDRATDIVRTLFYRPEYFGRAHNAYSQVAMRDDSYWEVGERELFAGFVSKKNQCPF